MNTETIIYVVAAALILRVIIKIVLRMNKDSKTSLPTEDKKKEEQ